MWRLSAVVTLRWLIATDRGSSGFACYVTCAAHITQIACIFQRGELKTVACHVRKIVKYLPADYTDVPSGRESGVGGELSRRLVKDFQGVFLSVDQKISRSVVFVHLLGLCFVVFLCFLIYNSCLDESFGCAK